MRFVAACIAVAAAFAAALAVALVSGGWWGRWQKGGDGWSGWEIGCGIGGNGEQKLRRVIPKSTESGASWRYGGGASGGAAGSAEAIAKAKNANSPWR